MSNLLALAGVNTRIGPYHILQGVDFAVPRGGLTMLLGRNGAGKTTTLRLLSTILQPDEGTATINGFDLVEQAPSVRRSIGVSMNPGGIVLTVMPRGPSSWARALVNPTTPALAAE